MAETWLITGGAGNLACQLTFQLKQPARRLVLFDIAPHPVAPVAAGCVYERGDIRRVDTLAQMFEQYEPAVVIHFASLLSGKSELDRPLSWQVNMDGAFQLFELSVRHGVQQFFFPSSVASFGPPLPNPVPEDFPQWPVGLYGVAKACVERLGMYYHARHGLDFRCIRVPIVVSAWAHVGAASSYASLAFIESARQGRFTFRVRPETQPALIYAADLVRAVTDLTEVSAAQLTRRSYNVQSLSPTCQQLADAVQLRFPDADVQFDPDPKVTELIESWPVTFEDASARRDWGWTPRFGLDAMADHFADTLTNL